MDADRGHEGLQGKEAAGRGTASTPSRAFGPRNARGLCMRAASIAAAVALGASCSSGGGSAAPSTMTRRPPTSVGSTSTVAPGEAEVLGAYRAFWDAYLAAADPMDPASPLLAQHATGTQLETVQRAFLARRAGGEVIRGTLDLAPRVISIVGDTAAVRDCYLDNTGVYDAAGTRKDAASGVRHLVTATLKLDGGVWKVSDLKKEGDGCTAA
jgi:hypothetical protein